ncbi:hypothetical protein V5O48_016208 [Marasmius crinis-equi]|uniref:Uncharacterized protein n=1 Tax=Marasmius crinis-equi TaxID=585013 RepID=A0ABR3ESE7_9AGAR
MILSRSGGIGSGGTRPLDVLDEVLEEHFEEETVSLFADKDELMEVVPVSRLAKEESVTEVEEVEEEHSLEEVFVPEALEAVVLKPFPDKLVEGVSVGRLAEEVSVAKVVGLGVAVTALAGAACVAASVAAGVGKGTEAVLFMVMKAARFLRAETLNVHLISLKHLS